MIGERLAQVRRDAGLSLRDFASRLHEEAGCEVSYTTVRNYERSESVPSSYLQAVARVFGVDAAWLLHGEGESARQRRSVRVQEALAEIRRQLSEIAEGEDPDLDADGITDAWKRFRRGLDPDHPLRSVILESWKRSERAGLGDAPQTEPSPRRVPPDELERHRSERVSLREAALPHLTWLSGVVAPTLHVAYLTCRHGVVLEARGPEPELIEEQGLAPGFDWSEEAMGTNGAGTALAADRPVVVVGREHFVPALRDFVCTACPVHGPDDEVVGALDLSTSVRHGFPERLALVAYAAWAVERELVTAVGVPAEPEGNPA